MGNVASELEKSEVDDADIEFVEKELSRIKGTCVDGGNSHKTRMSRADPGGGRSDLPLSPSPEFESSPSSPSEFHSARNSETFSFVECFYSDEDGMSGDRSRSDVKGQLSGTELETSATLADSSDEELDDGLNEKRLEEEYGIYLNPATLSDTGSEVSDFESDFDMEGPEIDLGEKITSNEENIELLSTENPSGGRNKNDNEENNERNIHDISIRDVTNVSSYHEKHVGVSEENSSNVIEHNGTMAEKKEELARNDSHIVQKMNEQDTLTCTGMHVHCRDVDTASQKADKMGVAQSNESLSNIGDEDGQQSDTEGMGVIDNGDMGQGDPAEPLGGSRIVPSDYIGDKNDDNTDKNSLTSVDGRTVASDNEFLTVTDISQVQGNDNIISNSDIYETDNVPELEENTKTNPESMTTDEFEGSRSDKIENLTAGKYENNDKANWIKSGESVEGSYSSIVTKSDEDMDRVKTEETVELTPIEELGEKQRLLKELVTKVDDLVNSSFIVYQKIREYNVGNMCELAGDSVARERAYREGPDVAVIHGDPGTANVTNDVGVTDIDIDRECNVSGRGRLSPGEGNDTEGNVNGMADQRGGHSRSPGPGGGGGSQHDPGGQRSPGPGFYRHRALDCPQTILDVDYQLLQSGICILPGCRDLEGRSVVFIFTSSCIWQNQQVSSVELARHLMYYRSVPREDVRCRGMTVVANVQGASVSTINILLEALYLFEGNCRGGIAVIHLLADEQSQGLVQRSPVYDSHTPFKLDILLTEELLTEFISLDQLPLVLDGLFVYNHEEWIRFHMELDPFVSKIRTVAKYLVCIMQELSEVETMPKTSKESGQLIEHHQHLVKSAFKDQRFVSLQAEGESIINCLRREDLHMGHSEDYRDSMESVNKLYDHLNNTMVRLVHLADSRLTKLERCLQLREFEEECTKIIEWTTRDGEEFLCRHAQLADNLKGIKSQQKEFEKFYFQAMTHIEKGNDLLEEASLLAQSGNFDEATGYKELARSLKKNLQDFTGKLEDTREKIESTTKCYHLLDRTYEWALEAMKYAASMKMEHCESFSGLEKLLQSLELYLRDHPVMKPETFENMFHLAEKLKSEKLLEQCRVAKARCEETQNLLNLRRTTLKRAKEKMIEEQNRQLGISSDGNLPVTCSEQRRDSNSVSSVALGDGSPKIDRTGWNPSSTSTPHGNSRPRSRTSHPELRKCVSEKAFNLNRPIDPYITEDMSDRIVTALPKKLTDSKLRSENSENIRLNESAGHAEKFSLPHSSTSPHPFASPHSSMLSNSSIQSPGSALSPHSRPLKKVLRRTATQPLTDNVIIEEEDQHVDRQTDGQHAKLRPFSMITASTDSLSSLPEEEGEDQENGGPCPPPRDWKATPIPVNTHLSSNNQNMPPVADLKLSGSEKSKRTLALVMREMIQTERDYVLALQYIMENYMPELRREDVPQALRGKSNVIFGNLEKIYNFHRQYFLREVEMCERNPFQIAHYFLMHESQFYMYALYNKNKPKSDCLMAEYGKQFFRDKQLQLGDRMDLASYLLKPVQRMGKYALLLKQIMKECPQSEQEYQDLKAAEQMVKFQLRHGNDLLAMDSLKDCDVNLQEQGRLLRQDEFIVWQGRRKSLRHVFLFEDLILFSKTRRGRNGSPDTYIYKYSYKMADIGMTESYGDTGYKFEIWFRKLSKGDNYVLQASSSEVRHHWVREISRILWNQAIRNKETHLTEMATMGIGNKPSLDLKPSADNIQDRYINVTSGNFQARTRNSIAVSSFDHFRQNNKRPHSIISVSSNSSSSSSHSGALGAFNLGFDPRDSPRHQSCSTNVSNESGIGTDVSSGEIELTPRADHQGIPVFTSPSSRGYKDPGKSKLLLNSSFNDTVGTNV